MKGRLTTLEIFIIEAIFFMLLWLVSNPFATIMTIILVPIVTILLIISIIAELLERSKVPRQYFYIMLVTIICPIVVAMIFNMVVGIDMSWWDRL